MSEAPTKQVVVVFDVDVRVPKEAIAAAIEKMTPHFKHATCWDNLMAFLEDLPEIGYDPDDDDDDPSFASVTH